MRYDQSPEEVCYLHTRDRMKERKLRIVYFVSFKIVIVNRCLCSADENVNALRLFRLSYARVLCMLKWTSSVLIAAAFPFHRNIFCFLFVALIVSDLRSVWALCMRFNLTSWCVRSTTEQSQQFCFLLYFCDDCKRII